MEGSNVPRAGMGVRCSTESRRRRRGANKHAPYSASSRSVGVSLENGVNGRRISLWTADESSAGTSVMVAIVVGGSVTYMTYFCDGDYCRGW